MTLISGWLGTHTTHIMLCGATQVDGTSDRGTPLILSCQQRGAKMCAATTVLGLVFECSEQGSDGLGGVLVSIN
jgi:hypothetical protein